ncbi:MAG: hypothetical protein IJT63_03910 [Lachnospiraceae bacterium]|nr:hypothetical protein [Lachnospiraceae bacterium]
MRGIKRRQKGFLALVLAVVIGILPTVEVWAATFTITGGGNNIKINDGTSDIIDNNTDGNTPGTVIVNDIINFTLKYIIACGILLLEVPQL